MNQPILGSKDFLESNNSVVKFAFLIVVIIAFVILLKVGIYILTYFLSPSNQSTILINGMVDAKQTIIFPQDPSQMNSVTIQRSSNATDGIEFTWSVWIYINSLNDYLQGKYKNIFYKGNNDLSGNGLNFPNNAPGLYIAPDTNTLVVIMNTFEKINEEIQIPDIPLNKWINVIMRCSNKTFDVFINGVITRSTTFIGVPKQNYGDVHVAMNGGFDGYISNLYYNNHALGTSAIQSIVDKGPNTSMVSKYDGMNMKGSNYLSLRWFFNGSNDLYNP
jgi:hypothetical protein